ncbi:hypothetical protein KVT40_002186 [Elsinoe batatas]|uniref:Uncharacterized protein n=1 Tax=Elsinoe batatas TaxID=2601811 RepID=A0A8K0L7W8_9PEZI|nr:hypothetical protein KVT40_002186 [Elsinoe batatas]
MSMFAIMRQPTIPFYPRVSSFALRLLPAQVCDHGARSLTKELGNPHQRQTVPPRFRT